MLPAIGVTLAIGFDMPIEILKISGANFAYKQEIYFVFAFLIGMINMRRSVQRWMGVKMVSQTEKFMWNEPMNKSRISQVMMYLAFEAILFILMGCVFYILSPESIMVAAVLLIFGIDHLVFALVSKTKNLFRVGVTKAAIVFADRDVRVAYFSGLRKVSIQQRSIYFDYIKDLQISCSLDAVNQDKIQGFKEALETNANRDRVHFSEAFKSL